jgi:hypothetical protein
MNRLLVGRVLSLGLLVVLVVLALSACGGDEKKAKAHPLPEDEKALRPGTYLSEEFEPSLSFRVGEGWTNVPLETSDELQIRRTHKMGGLGFGVIHEVYKPSDTASPNLIKAPKDMVAWFQHHPYLKTSKPKPVTVGGVKGEQFDVLMGNLPEDYSGVCGTECVDITRFSDGSILAHPKENKARLIVLEDVKGKTVTMGFGSPASEFGEHAPKAQKVLDSVEWRGS